MNKKILNNNSGLLLFALMLMLGLLILAGALLARVFYNMKMTNAQINTVQAKYLAYAGINRAIYYLTNADPLTAHNTDGSWRTTACSESVSNVAPCTTVSSASTTCTGGAPCIEKVTIGSGAGAYTMWVETSSNDIQITSAGTYPVDSNAVATAGAVTKYFRVKVNYRSYLEMWFKMDEGKGTNFTDSSGNGNYMIPGSTTSTWIHTTSCPITSGHCHTFTAANSYWWFGTLASNIRPMLSSGRSGACTFAVWINMTSAPAAAAQYALLANNTGKYGFKIYSQAANDPRLCYRSLNNSATLNYGTQTIGLNAWHHVAFTVDGLATNTSLKLYYDGASDAVATNNTIYSTIGMNTLASDTTAAELFQGSMDDVRFYTRALTAAEISSIYNAGSGTATADVPPAYGFVSVLPQSFREM